MVSELTPFVIIRMYWSLINQKYVLLYLYDAPVLSGRSDIYPVDVLNSTYLRDLETISFKYLSLLLSVLE